MIYFLIIFQNLSTSNHLFFLSIPSYPSINPLTDTSKTKEGVRIGMINHCESLDFPTTTRNKGGNTVDAISETFNHTSADSQDVFEGASDFNANDIRLCIRSEIYTGKQSLCGFSCLYNILIDEKLIDCISTVLDLEAITTTVGFLSIISLAKLGPDNTQYFIWPPNNSSTTSLKNFSFETIIPTRNRYMMFLLRNLFRYL